MSFTAGHVMCARSTIFTPGSNFSCVTDAMGVITWVNVVACAGFHKVIGSVTIALSAACYWLTRYSIRERKMGQSNTSDIRWTKGETDDDGLETWQSETDESWQRERDMPRGQLSRTREKINKFNASQRPTK